MFWKKKSEKWNDCDEKKKSFVVFVKITKSTCANTLNNSRLMLLFFCFSTFFFSPHFNLCLCSWLHLALCIVYIEIVFFSMANNASKKATAQNGTNEKNWKLRGKKNEQKSVTNANQHTKMSSTESERAKTKIEENVSQDTSTQFREKDYFFFCFFFDMTEETCRLIEC